MDVDGFLLLMERDFNKFQLWEKTSKNQSLEELKENYNYWRDHFKEASEKYWNIEKDQKDKDISLFMGKLTYFLYLSRFGWNSLSAYTERLQEETGQIKKPKETTNKKPKSKRRKS